ncbi:hypothetical protein T492DRAFT_887623 [Pavlovales sp. CCMP2436]|nr:hypothetical protein T492DRAFT_887623 [Pavlovales sp. CCMP2436]
MSSSTENMTDEPLADLDELKFLLGLSDSMAADSSMTDAADLQLLDLQRDLDQAIVEITDPAFFLDDEILNMIATNAPSPPRTFGPSSFFQHPSRPGPIPSMQLPVPPPLRRSTPAPIPPAPPSSPRQSPVVPFEIPAFPRHLLDPNRLSDNQLALLVGTAKQHYLSKYDPTSAYFLRDARQSLFCEIFRPPEFNIGGASVWSSSRPVDTRTLIVYICASSKITGQVLKVRLIEKAHVVFGRYMLKAYMWGIYSFRIIVSLQALPMPGTALPPDASAPTYHFWGQNFDIIPMHIPADIHQAVHTQIRQDLIRAVRATPGN